MIVQETHLIEYKGRVIPLYRGICKKMRPYNQTEMWYAQFGNVSEYDEAQVVEFEEISEKMAMELIENSSI